MSDKLHRGSASWRNFRFFDILANLVHHLNCFIWEIVGIHYSSYLATRDASNFLGGTAAFHRMYRECFSKSRGRSGKFGCTAAVLQSTPAPSWRYNQNTRAAVPMNFTNIVSSKKTKRHIHKRKNIKVTIPFYCVCNIFVFKLHRKDKN